jgi:hypothetical protein
MSSVIEPEKETVSEAVSFYFTSPSLCFLFTITGLHELVDLYHETEKISVEVESQK